MITINKAKFQRKTNFEKFAIGSKIYSYDSFGYYVMEACGYVVKHLGDGHAIIKNFDGVYYSTLSLSNIYDVEVIK